MKRIVITPPEVRERRIRKVFGCSMAEYYAIGSEAGKKFCQQRTSAKKRGIGWELEFSQWWLIWLQSGKWALRNTSQGYVMCRKGDIGPYAIDNVFIATARENSSHQVLKKSGLPMGVKKRGLTCFAAERGVNGKKIYLGCHRTPELAHAAYLAAAPQ